MPLRELKRELEALKDKIAEHNRALHTLHTKLDALEGKSDTELRRLSGIKARKKKTWLTFHDSSCSGRFSALGHSEK